jgi:protein-tyrosine phosphatase
MNSILVVCEGNICRSPMAQGLLARAMRGVSVRSAGLSALEGMPAQETAVGLMQALGIDITGHRAAQITGDMCLSAELVLVMEEEQRRRLETAYPFARGRVFRMGEFGKYDVPDPYGRAQEAYRESLQLIDQGVREWQQRIRHIREANA